MNLFPRSVLTAPRLARQEACLALVDSAFGSEVINDQERARSLVADAIGLAQSLGVSKEDTLDVVEACYPEPHLSTADSIGAVAVALYSLAELLGYAVDYEEVRVMTRLLNPPVQAERGMA